MEILAPCGNMESFTAAKNAGATAVYLGLKRFSARANAMNFDFDELREVCIESRLHAMKVYLALNTLVYDNELSEIAEYIKNAAALKECGISAVIVQDLAVAELVKQAGLPIHASTQMTVTTVKGAKLLKSMGFSRVVLARELKREEIREITEESGIETEVFVHGAHCVSVSGQCYMSALLGGRSGNRGNCAQPCRLDFRAGDSPYALSLKDLSLINHIAELREMGVTSLKIEGRMKRPEYVAAAVTACKKALAGQALDLEQLKSVFSRSGFTDGYYTGNYRDMQGIRTKEDVAATAKALEQIKSEHKTPVKRHVIDFFVQITLSSAICTATVGDLSVTVTGETPEKALNKALTADYVNAQMAKLGGTVFEVGKIAVTVEAGLSMSASAINALRRKSIEKISERMVDNHD